MTDFRRCGVSARDDRTAIREADDRVSAHKEPCLYSNAAEEMPIMLRWATQSLSALQRHWTWQRLDK